VTYPEYSSSYPLPAMSMGRILAYSAYIPVHTWVIPIVPGCTCRLKQRPFSFEIPCADVQSGASRWRTVRSNLNTVPLIQLHSFAVGCPKEKSYLEEGVTSCPPSIVESELSSRNLPVTCTALQPCNVPKSAVMMLYLALYREA
jgi:hypothetical protein